MPNLHLELQDGFSDDHVRMRVNGRSVFDRQHVITGRLLGLAEAIDVAIDPGPNTVEITVVNRNLSTSLSLAVTADIYVAAYIHEGRLLAAASDRELGLM